MIISVTMCGPTGTKGLLGSGCVAGAFAVGLCKAYRMLTGMTCGAALRVARCGSRGCLARHCSAGGMHRRLAEGTWLQRVRGM